MSMTKISIKSNSVAKCLCPSYNMLIIFPFGFTLHLIVSEDFSAIEF